MLVESVRVFSGLSKSIGSQDREKHINVDVESEESFPDGWIWNALLSSQGSKQSAAEESSF